MFEYCILKFDLFECWEVFGLTGGRAGSEGSFFEKLKNRRRVNRCY